MNKKTIIDSLGGFVIGAILTYFIMSAQTQKPDQRTATSSEEASMAHDLLMMKEIGGMTMDDMTSSLEGKTGDEFDKAFLSGMIEHHKGAVLMSNVATISAGHAEIKNMAKDIITTQNKEINQMKEWQKSWGY